ncbi:MAG: DUF6145 family protein [Lachnospiraceae bacterium]|nr:DUF6145 family protein [Lachnospiraceae bacterium]
MYDTRGQKVMYDEEIVLCASSAYTKQFYLNPEFDGLPEQVKEELKILCVLYTEDVGGVLVMKFEEDGSLRLETSFEEGDLLYDEIGSVLKIKQIQNLQSELLESLELYYRVVFLGETGEE